MSTSCSVLWCADNWAGECTAIESADFDENYDHIFPDEFRCPGCDIVLYEGLVLEAYDDDEGMDSALDDCYVGYVSADPKAKILVIKKLGDNPDGFEWVAVRASEEYAKSMRVFPHVGGGLSWEIADPRQTELDLGV